ncbi:hypothetical protein V6N13_137536 [Hibiscus sabdariffa]
MSNLCLCGSGTFHRQEEEDGDDIWSTSPVCSPRKSKRKKDSKNPYSTRGLDRFTALLEELEEKRQKIYSQTGSQSLVRFVYKNANDYVPIVVNLKDKNEEKIKPENTKERYVSEAINKLQISSEPDKNMDMKAKKTKTERLTWKIVEFQNLRKPSYYIPAIIILILLFLTFVGRSVAILCTCVGWYMVPTINGEGSNLRTSMKKKD